MGSAQALAKGTAGVEHACEAERAAAAKSEALAPWTHGETGCEIKTLREGKREADESPPEALLRECEYEDPEPIESSTIAIAVTRRFPAHFGGTRP
jgi:hypothetical protein